MCAQRAYAHATFDKYTNFRQETKTYRYLSQQFALFATLHTPAKPLKKRAKHSQKQQY
jgi:hypothetical protein